MFAVRALPGFGVRLVRGIRVAERGLPWKVMNNRRKE